MIKSPVVAPCGLISLCTIALDEEVALERLLQDFEAQDFPHDRIEIILVDGGSVDNTRKSMEEFALTTSTFHSVKVLNNPGRIQPCGWNVAISNSAGDVIIRVDAHASIPPDFISRNIEILEQGEFVCGGYRPTALFDSTPFSETLLLAEHVALGGSFALNRKRTQTAYVSTVFHGAYRREVFEKAGMFDERLMRTEDNEIHYRIRKVGYRIRFDERINSQQFIRTSLKEMLRQKCSNGFWVGLTLHVCPGCISLYHLVPFGLIILILLGIFIGALLSWAPLIVLGCLYTFLDLGMSVFAIIGSAHKNATMALLPLVVLAIHLCYGWGSAVGIVRGFFWNKTDRI
jgi:glycosyltransferase involved in cell wall biosynthesis